MHAYCRYTTARIYNNNTRLLARIILPLLSVPDSIHGALRALVYSLNAYTQCMLKLVCLRAFSFFVNSDIFASNLLDYNARGANIASRP